MFPDARFIDTNGIRMAVYEQGAGLPVVFSHGFPELAYSWRHQLDALAAAGFRAIAPDQRGYGKTDCPEPVEAYDMAHLTGDLIGLLDALEIERAVFAGHDWGGAVVWAMGQQHPDRTAGVIGVNTPFMPRAPIKPTEMIRQTIGENYYVLQFQPVGPAEAALERDVRTVFRSMFRKGVTRADYEARAEQQQVGTGMLESIGKEEPQGQPLMDDAELEMYASAFEKTGFRGGLNWYRNIDRNWEASADVPARVDVPSLMVSGADDPVLRPEGTEGMEAFVPDLEKHVIDHCGHWTQQEQPAELNRLIIDWLKRRF